MIFRRETRQTESAGAEARIRPAFQVFLDVQKTDPPAAVVLQPDHSRLAGEIAKALRPEIFGALPHDVIRAIAEHDFGWRESDQAQIANMRAEPLRPFPRLSAAQSDASWRESVRRAESRSPLEGVIVSRHFCALSLQDPAHGPFADEENARRAPVEQNLGISAADLDRYTAAIGFCDLVSLYLCSGAREAAEFPLAHPALPNSRDAHRVALEWRAAQPRFSSPVVRDQATVSAAAFEPETAGGLRPITIHWAFAI